MNTNTHNNPSNPNNPITIKSKAQSYINNFYLEESSDFYLFLQAALLFDDLIKKLQKAVYIANCDGTGVSQDTLNLHPMALSGQKNANTTNICPTCQGKGIKKITFDEGYSNDELCPDCNGSVDAHRANEDIIECEQCNGQGVILSDGDVWECNNCNGNGKNSIKND